MHFTPAEIVSWYGVVVTTTAVFAMTAFFAAAWFGFGQAVFWRGLKLLTTLMGSLGVVFLLLNFEKFNKETFLDVSKEQALSAFFEVKSALTHFLARACSDPSSLAVERCKAARRIDKHIIYNNILAFIPYETVDHRSVGLDLLHDSEFGPFLKELNSKIGNLNSVRPRAEYKVDFLSTDAKTSLFLISPLLIIFGLAGSVGEAAFQLRQEKAKPREVVRNA